MANEDQRPLRPGDRVAWAEIGMRLPNAPVGEVVLGTVVSLTMAQSITETPGGELVLVEWDYGETHAVRGSGLVLDEN